MMKQLFILFFILFNIQAIYAQDRFEIIEKQLTEISKDTPGLEEKVDFSVVGVSVQEFLRGLAEANNLNISVDPSLEIRVYNNFTNEKVKNIIMFLLKEYQLDIHFVGSIMSFKKYTPPAIEVPKQIAKSVDLKYDADLDKITLNLKGDSIQKVVSSITNLTKKNVVLDPRIKPGKLVTGYILNTPFESAMDKFAFTNGLELEKTDDNFFILREVPTQAQINNQSSNRNNRNSRNSRGNSNNRNANNQLSGDIEISIKDSIGIKFLSFDAQNVAITDIIKQVSQEIGENYFLFSEPAGNTTAHLSNITYEDFLKYILHGTQHTFKKQEKIYMIGERNLEGLRSTKVINLKYRSFQDVMTIIPSELTNGVQISEFSELNSFILSGSAPQIAEIEAFVHDIDKIVPLIMIEVIMVDINREHKVETGIKAGVSDDPPAGGGTLLEGLDYVLSSSTINQMTSPLNLGKVDKRFYLSLKALETNKTAQIRSMPKLATLNSHEATLSIGITRNFVLENSNIIGTQNPTVSNSRQVSSSEANLEINITPVVSGDDQVTLNITISNSDFISEPQGDRPPDTRNSSFTSLIRVRDNDMVLLGGLEKINKSESGSGIPLLARIPIIKWFFSSRAKSRNKTISVVFIKPSIIY